MNEEPLIPYLVKKWKNRKVSKKEDEIRELELEIAKAKLQKELDKVKGGE